MPRSKDEEEGDVDNEGGEEPSPVAAGSVQLLLAQFPCSSEPSSTPWKSSNRSRRTFQAQEPEVGDMHKSEKKKGEALSPILSFI
jgi:hypothetical protein